MKKSINFFFLISISFFLSGYHSTAQTGFANSNSRLKQPAFHSGCPVTVVDWNGDGKDDIIRLDQGYICYVEVQRTNNQFDSIYLGQFGSGSSQWAMAAADIDHNGYVDVVAGGSSSAVEILMSNNQGNGASFTYIPNSNFFLQNMSFGDINNDGWIDLFCCDDNDAAHMYLNDGAGSLIPSTMINFALNPTIFYGGDPADSGNYGSVWTDFDNDGDMDLFVAHCRQASTDSTDLRRKDRLFVNDGTNNYTEMSSLYGIEPVAFNQTWTASFGDIDNDGDLDLMLTNHNVPSQILQNDGTGHYMDITASTGFNISDITPIESVMEDFDNDGWIDIFATGSDSRFFHNNGNGTFTRIKNLFDNNSMESFAIGDLNHDGFIDIYASYAGIYTNPTNINDVVWLNNSNSNHFLTMDLRGTVSNHSAIGTSVKLYSSLGIQVREVRAGESYGTNNSTMCHFGLGQVTTVDSVVVRFPSGITQTIINPHVDQFIKIVEGDCVSPPAYLTPAAPFVLCTGQTLNIFAPAGYNYLWNDSTNNQSVFVTTIGEYSVEVTEPGNNCVATSPTANVVFNPNQTPTITALSDPDFCLGSSIQIAGPLAQLGYLWSNGETTQTITVTQSGTYMLTTQGNCQQWNSNAIHVTVHPYPSDPVSSDVTLQVPGTATLVATGNNDLWFDVPTGGNSIYNGNSFLTPWLNDTTTFYVEDANTWGGGIFATGLPYATNTYSAVTTNNQEFFDVLDFCTLKSVKVYTDLPGIRKIELRDQNNVLVNSALVNILPDTQVVNLNWSLTPGSQYTLGTDGVTNQAIPGNGGNVSPRLKRNSSGVNYPYTIADAVSITNSGGGSQYYYYFYDWQVEKKIGKCASNRIPVTVFIVNPVGIADNEFVGITVYPNPTKDYLHVNFDNKIKSMVSVFDQIGKMVLNETLIEKSNQLNIANLSAGVYSMKIQNTKGQFVYKIIVE